MDNTKFFDNFYSAEQHFEQEKVILDSLKDLMKRVNQLECLIEKKETDLYNIRISILSAREKQILEMVCKGKHSLDIAAELYLSKHTVDTHRRNILKKLNTPLSKIKILK